MDMQFFALCLLVNENLPLHLAPDGMVAFEHLGIFS